MSGRPVAAFALALILPGCLGGGDASAPPNQAGPLRESAKLQSSTFSDWRRATLRERMLTVDRLEEVVAGPRKGGSHAARRPRVHDHRLAVRELIRQGHPPG